MLNLENVPVCLSPAVIRWRDAFAARCQEQGAAIHWLGALAPQPRVWTNPEVRPVPPFWRQRYQYRATPVGGGELRWLPDVHACIGEMMWSGPAAVAVAEPALVAYLDQLLGSPGYRDYLHDSAQNHLHACTASLRTAVRSHVTWASRAEATQDVLERMARLVYAVESLEVRPPSFAGQTLWQPPEVISARGRAQLDVLSVASAALRAPADTQQVRALRAAVGGFESIALNQGRNPPGIDGEVFADLMKTLERLPPADLRRMAGTAHPCTPAGASWGWTAPRPLAAQALAELPQEAPAEDEFLL